MTYNMFDIVVVPFPFTDTKQSKRRPAIILSSYNSFNKKIKHSVMAMITSARNTPWPLDTSITDLHSSGLPKPSVIRLKLFTLDHRLVIEKIGTLSSIDQIEFKKNFKLLFKSTK